MNGKVLKYSIQSFFFLGNVFWKENLEDRVKLLDLSVLNCIAYR